MIRSQILLNKNIISEVKKIAKSRGISQSETVRTLLEQALSGSHITGITETKQDYIQSLGNFKLKNPRIDGFKEIFSVGGKTPEIKIVGPEMFEEYLKTRNLPVDLEFELAEVCAELKKSSVTGTLVVRRAYVVPGLENPPGPRFLGLQSTKVAGAVKAIYDFAIEHEYYLKSGSSICVFIHPFLDPKPVTSPIMSGVQLPYGGYAAPLNDEASRVEVFAVWGNNEGVQSFDAIDRYVVDTKRQIILDKNCPQKSLMFCTTKKSQSEKIPVPQDRQFEQVLSDSEILEAGRVVYELSKKYGLRRVEFTYDGLETILFNESAPYKIYEKEIKNIDKVGEIFAISSEKDVEALRSLNTSKNKIVYIDKKIVEERAYDVLNSVAGLPEKYMVLYPGLSATAHAMRVLNDFGHTAIVVGNRIFKHNEKIIVKRVGSQIVIESLKNSAIKNLVVNLYDAKLYGRDLVGGKATNLSILKSKGYNVPHGLVLTTEFCQKPRNWDEVFKSIDLDKKKKYAVRSSADIEDKTDHAFAGQFETYLNTNYEDIPMKVREVIKSASAKRIHDYFASMGSDWSVKMAVVVQEMIDVDKSGVVFGKDLQTGDEDLIVMDVALGLGDGVVNGTAKTQRIIYSRSKNKLINDKAGNAKNLLTRMEIDSLVEMTFSVEKLIGEVQDIEWAIDKKGAIWLIQTRGLQ